MHVKNIKVKINAFSVLLTATSSSLSIGVFVGPQGHPVTLPEMAAIINLPLHRA